MLDWNWRILKTGLGFLVVLGLMGVFAWFTRTVPHAIAGTLFALAIQSGLYLFAAVNHVHPSFDLARPLHLMIRWDRIGFRTVKIIVEMLGLALMGLIAYKFLVTYQIATFLAFGLLFTGAPVPLLLWTYYVKVLGPSFVDMGQGAPDVVSMPIRPRDPMPVARPLPPPRILPQTPPAPPFLTDGSRRKIPFHGPGHDEVL